MASRYTADFFIKKFRKTPEKRWIMDEMHKGPAHCALGHCSPGEEVSPMGRRLESLFDNWLNRSVPDVNDSRKTSIEVYDYGMGKAFYIKGKSPRQRILSALRLIKEIQQKGAK